MTTELTVSGMSCGNCVKHVDAAVRGVAGVTDAKVEVGRVVVTAAAGVDATALVPALVAAIDDAGYAAAPAAK